MFRLCLYKHKVPDKHKKIKFQGFYLLCHMGQFELKHLYFSCVYVEKIQKNKWISRICLNDCSFQDNLSLKYLTLFDRGSHEIQNKLLKISLSGKF